MQGTLDHILLSPVGHETADLRRVLLGIIMLYQIPSCDILGIHRQIHAFLLLILRNISICLVQISIQPLILLFQILKFQPVLTQLDLLAEHVHTIISAIKIHIHIDRLCTALHARLNGHVVGQLIADIGGIVYIAQKDPAV